MEIERVILNRVLKLREKTKCTKFVGALTVELLRNELIGLGYNVSNRDVFIEGVPNELDLLIARKDNEPQENLVYLPKDVLVVFEIRFRGSYGKDLLPRLKKVFGSIRELNRKIECFYVSISENENYKHRITKKDLGFDCFELLTRKTNLESALMRKEITSTGDWGRLLERLNAIC